MRSVIRFSRLMAKGSDPVDPAPRDPAPTLEASDLATADPPAQPCPPAHLGRSQRLRTNLEAALDQLQHARSEAGQIAELLADYDTKARLADTLNARMQELMQALDDERARTTDLATRNSELGREVTRANEEATRAHDAAQESRSEASALYLAQQRETDRMTALTARLSALQAEFDTARDAKERAEVDASSLRSILVERDHALRALQGKESEWRLRAEKDAGQMAELCQAAERKERRIAELSGALDKSAKRVEELEERTEREREQLRQLEIRHNDLNVSTESRIYTLTQSLSQEQAGHRVTRKLLEEMRSQSQTIADENKLLKDQAVNLAQENQQMKLELGGTRGTIRDYGERLGEMNLRFSAAQDDIERLESVIAEGKKETRRLKRRAGRVDDLQSENASLHDKIKSLQHTLEQYRSGSGAGQDAPIMLSSRRMAGGSAPVSQASPIVKMPRAT